MPSSANVWLPVTEKLPAEPVTVPVEAGVPSPQLILAEYSPAGADVSGSVNLATGPENSAPSVAPTGVSATTIRAPTRKTSPTAAVLPPLSVTVAVIG